MMMREGLRQKEKSLQLGTHKEEITSDDSCVRLLHSLLLVAYENPIIKKKLIVLSMVGFICMIHIIRLANRNSSFLLTRAIEKGLIVVQMLVCYSVQTQTYNCMC